VTTLARLASLTAALLYATADALDAFARSLAVQQERCPDVIPAYVDDGSASW
jgi:hypothetical protein